MPLDLQPTSHAKEPASRALRLRWDIKQRHISGSQWASLVAAAGVFRPRIAVRSRHLLLGQVQLLVRLLQQHQHQQQQQQHNHPTVPSPLVLPTRPTLIRKRGRGSATDKTLLVATQSLLSSPVPTSWPRRSGPRTGLLVSRTLSSKPTYACSAARGFLRATPCFRPLSIVATEG